MPQAVAAIKSAVGWFVATWKGGGIGAFLLKTATAVTLSIISSKLFGPKVPKQFGMSGLRTMSRSSVEYRKIVYGQAMVSGPIVYNNVQGVNNEYLWFVIALADHLSEDLVEVWFDGQSIPKADISWTAGTGASDGTGTGAVSTSYFVGNGGANAVNIFYYLGSSTQPVCGPLNTAIGEIGANHRGRGITYIVVKLLYDEDTAELWETGIPQNIKAVIKGRKIYDPRLDSTVIIDPTTSPVTYGSGSHDYTDSTTWAWSANPALCVADYLTQVMGVAPATGIDWPSIANAADDCDATSSIPPATSPETQETRFTCNGAISMGSTHKENLEALLSSCDGRLTYSAGTWKLRASVWEASSVSYDKDDLAGPIQIRGSAPRSERFNTIKGVFVDASRLYEAVEFPHVTDATYVTRDNGKTIEYDLQLPMTNSSTMAQRVAYRVLDQSNNQIVVDLTLGARGAKVTTGDVFDLTLDELSWTSKTFRCIAWSRNPDGTFSVTGREDSSAAYNDPLVTDYGTASTTAVTVPASVVPPPTGFSATGVGAGIRLDWTNPASDLYDVIEIYESATDAWGGASKIAEVDANSYTVPLDAGTTRWYWLRALRRPILQSDRIPDSDTSTITATSTSATSGSATVFVNQYIRSAGTPSTPGTTSASYNFDTTTFTPTSTWSQGVPAQTSPTTAVWVSTAQFYAENGTGTDSNTTWTAPQKLAEDGTPGSDGTTGSAGSATVFVNQFIRASAQPSTPGTTSASYNFDTTTFTPTSTWSVGVPAQTSPISAVWVSTAQFYSSDGTGTDSSTTWTTPQKLAEDGVPGVAGAAGSATVYVSQYIRSAGAPSTPGTTSASYNFDTEPGTFTPTSTWSASVPAQTSPTTAVWISTAQFYSSDGTGTDSSTTWSTPQKLAEDGTPGVDGGGGATIGSGIVNKTISDTVTSPDTAYCDFKVDNNGIAYKSQGVATPSWTTLYTWIGDGANTDYECRLQKNGNSNPTSGASTETWLACSTDREWSWDKTSNFVETYTIQFRRVSDNVLLAEADVAINIVVI